MASSSTVCGMALAGSGYSFISPVAGLSCPIRLPNWPAHQIEPSCRLDRIARALPERRHHPFLERDLDAVPDTSLGARGVRREIRREILDELVAHVRVARQVEHRADQLLPAVARVAQLAVIMLVWWHIVQRPRPPPCLAFRQDGGRLCSGPGRRAGRALNQRGDQRNGSAGPDIFHLPTALARSLPVNPPQPTRIRPPAIHPPAHARA